MGWQQPGMIWQCSILYGSTQLSSTAAGGQFTELVGHLDHICIPQMIIEVLSSVRLSDLYSE
jgi:hypothetical protein